MHFMAGTCCIDSNLHLTPHTYISHTFPIGHVNWHASAFENALASWCLCAYLVQMRADTSHKLRFESSCCMNTTTYTYSDESMWTNLCFRWPVESRRGMDRTSLNKTSSSALLALSAQRVVEFNVCYFATHLTARVMSAQRVVEFNVCYFVTHATPIFPFQALI